jgi:hypothetical protein
MPTFTMITCSRDPKQLQVQQSAFFALSAPHKTYLTDNTPLLKQHQHGTKMEDRCALVPKHTGYSVLPNTVQLAASNTRAILSCVDAL